MSDIPQRGIARAQIARTSKEGKEHDETRAAP